MSSLSSNLTKIKNATDVIRTAVSMPDDDIADVATAVSSAVASSKNSYRATSIANMLSIEGAEEGDICTVYGPEYEDMTIVDEGELEEAYNHFVLPEVIKNPTVNQSTVIDIMRMSTRTKIGEVVVDLEDSGVSDGIVTLLINIQDYVEVLSPAQIGFHLEIVYHRYLGEMEYALESVSYSIGGRQIEIQDNVIVMPFAFYFQYNCESNPFDDFGRLFRHFKVVPWNTLTYSNNLIFDHVVDGGTYHFDENVSCVLTPNPRYTPFDGSGLYNPLAIETHMNDSLTMRGCWGTREFDGDTNINQGVTVNYVTDSGEGDWDRASMSSTDEGKFVDQPFVDATGIDVIIPVRFRRRVALYASTNTMKAYLPTVAGFLKTYKDNSVTNYIYHDNAWNIIYDTI